MATPQRAHAPRRTSVKHPHKRTPREFALDVAKWVGVVALAVAVIGAGTFGVAYLTTTIPDPNKDFQTNISKVTYRGGQAQLGTFAIQNRVSLPLSEIPQNVKDAIVAAENETFYTDPGISVAGLARAVISALGPGDTVGGSTITQQYVKVMYLTQDKSLVRKLKEILLALKLSQDVPKDKILEGYLNTVYFGRGAYGVQAASQAFFGVDAKDLSYPQAIALTAMVNDPGRLDPLQGDKQRADLLERYQYAINQLVKTGKITEATKAQWYTTLPEFPPLKRDSRFSGPNGYLLKMVQDELKGAGFSDSQINGGGLQVVTTIDEKMQDAAVSTAQSMTAKAAGERKKDPAGLHAAIASVDVASGGVLALYGGADYVANNRNWATTARPTGSTFKPWALVAGLRNGITLNDMFNGDNKSSTPPVANAGGNSYGMVTLIKATTSSINTAYVDLVSQIKDGPNQVIKAAMDAGIPRNASFDPQPTIPLGYSEVSPLSAAGAFGTLANGGKQLKPHIVDEVRDGAGQVLYKAVVSTPQTIEPAVAQDAVYALTNVASEGTGRVVSSLGYDVGGKTGTRYDSSVDETKASWFVGFTKQIATAVMYVAGDDGNGNLDDYSSGFYGSGYPANTWLAYMRIAQKGLPKVDFPGPTKRVSTQKPTYLPTATYEPTDEPTDQPTDQPTRPGRQTTAPQPTDTTTAPGRGGTTTSTGRPTATATG